MVNTINCPVTRVMVNTTSCPVTRVMVNTTASPVTRVMVNLTVYPVTRVIVNTTACLVTRVMANTTTCYNTINNTINCPYACNGKQYVVSRVFHKRDKLFYQCSGRHDNLTLHETRRTPRV